MKLKSYSKSRDKIRDFLTFKQGMLLFVLDRGVLRIITRDNFINAIEKDLSIRLYLPRKAYSGR